MKNLFLVFLSVYAICYANKHVKVDKSHLIINKEIKEAAKNNIETKTLCTGWYFVSDTITDFKYFLEKSNENYYINPNPIVVKNNIKSKEIYKSDFKGQYKDYIGLRMQLDRLGTKNWAYATEKAMFKKLAFIIDNKLICTPQVNSQVTWGITTINRSEYSQEEIETFKKELDKKQ